MTELTWPLIVVVTDNAAEAERLRAILSAARYRILSVSHVETAAARIAGGGVGLAVLCISRDPRRTPVWESIAWFEKCAAGLPLIVVADEGSRALAIPPGVPISRMPPVVPEGDLVSTARRLIGGDSGRDDSARIVSLQGVKGGVGATTTALNLAALLTGQGRTILAEMRPGLGTLTSHFRPRHKTRSWAELAGIPENALTAADLRDYLWPCPQIPGLNLLLGPQSLGREFDWTAHVSRILRVAAEMVDYLVVDLPHCVSAVNRAALRVTDYFLLVLERDALCLNAGKLMMEALEAEHLLPHSSGAVAVSRVPLSAPVALSEVERELKLPIIGAIPPDPDLCLLAWQSQTAVVTLDRESLLAGSYAGMTEALTTALRANRARVLTPPPPARDRRDPAG